MQLRLVQIFHALNEANVNYLVVGGVAVVLHGHLRFTADLDLVVALDGFNVKNAIRAFSSLGYRPRAPVEFSDFADADHRQAWIHEKGLLVFSLWNPAVPGSEIDLFIEEPFSMVDALARATSFNLGETSVRVASIADLIELKTIAGRPKDLSDILVLKELEKKIRQTQDELIDNGDRE